MVSFASSTDKLETSIPFILTPEMIFSFLWNNILIYLNKTIDEVLTNRVFQKIIHLPYSYYHGKSTGEVISRIDDLAYVQNLISKAALSLFIDAPLSLVVMIILLCLNTKLFIIVFIIFIFYLLIILLFKNKLNNFVFQENEAKALATSYMTEAIHGFETIKGLGIENKITLNFKKEYQKKLEMTHKLYKFYNRINLLKEFISVTGQFLLIFVAIKLLKEGQMSLGSLLTYLILTSYFLSAIQNIINFDLEIKEAWEAINRVLDLTYYKQGKNQKRNQKQA